MKVEYSNLTVNRISECIDLFSEVYAKQTLCDYPQLIEEFLKESFKSKKKILTAIKNGDMYGFVATVNKNELVGFILLSNPNYIRKLAVKEEYQKLGIAKRLVEMSSFNQDCLVVHAAEKMIPFYEKVGFIKGGEMNRDKYPYLPMKLIINPFKSLS